ncbi:MAG: KamA family radical SAM protein [Deltaproteobacteria bacterium]|nr:KamA family radical SAM protein [Deltaproteobacteria bacterium]
MNPAGPVARQIGWKRCAPAEGSDPDPLLEQECSPAPGLIRRYENRALVLATRRCFVHCAFCTRLPFVRDQGGSELSVNVEAALGYIRGHEEIREVLVSGGDPLTLGDAALDDLLDALHSIPHVRLLRLATRAPMARPDRITDALCAMLRSHGPLTVAVHFNHPDELTPDAREALARLADAGLVLINQTVLLGGVNDDPEVLARLCWQLAEARVRPYSLLQCDRVAGTEGFWVGLERALDIAARLEADLPGPAVPAFVVDLPGWEGKARLGAHDPPRRVEGGFMITGRSGREILYPDP